MDIRTLLFADLVLQACCAAGMWLMSRNVAGLRDLRWFAASYAGIAGGILVLMFGGEQVAGHNLVAGRALFLLGALALGQGVNAFSGHRLWPVRSWLLFWISVVLADALIVGMGRDSAPLAAAFCCLFAFFFGYAGWRLWSGAPFPERQARRVTSAMLSGIAWLWVLRTARIELTGINPDIVGQDQFRFAGTVVYMVFSAAAAFGLVWMVTTRLRTQLEDQARTDGLTGVLNRRALELAAEREIAACRRRGTTLAVLALDLDHFKGMNDRFGHAGGDAALCAIASLLTHSLRRSDLVSRFGGEEFVAVLPDRDVGAALDVAERLRHEIEALAVPFERGELRMTASFGVAALRGEGDGWDAILRRADRALYAAKQAGRNCSLVEPGPGRSDPVFSLPNSVN